MAGAGKGGKGKGKDEFDGLFDFFEPQPMSSQEMAAHIRELVVQVRGLKGNINLLEGMMNEAFDENSKLKACVGALEDEVQDLKNDMYPLFSDCTDEEDEEEMAKIVRREKGKVPNPDRRARLELKMCCYRLRKEAQEFEEDDKDNVNKTVQETLDWISSEVRTIAQYQTKQNELCDLMYAIQEKRSEANLRKIIGIQPHSDSDSSAMDRSRSRSR